MAGGDGQAHEWHYRKGDLQQARLPVDERMSRKMQIVVPAGKIGREYRGAVNQPLCCEEADFRGGYYTLGGPIPPGRLAEVTLVCVYTLPDVLDFTLGWFAQRIG